MEQIYFAFCELFARGIENSQIPQSLQKWPVSIFEIWHYNVMT